MSSDDLEKKLRLADEAWNKGDVEKALDYLTEALEKNPDNRDVVLKCGEILIALDQVEQAKSLFNHYLLSHPDDKEIRQLFKNVTPEEIETKSVAQVNGKILIAVNLVPFKEKDRLNRQQLCIKSISDLIPLGIVPLNICYPDEMIHIQGWNISPTLERSADKVLNIQGKRKPFVKDLFEIAAKFSMDNNIDYFIITNSDIIFTEKLVKRVRELINEGYETITISRSDVLNIDNILRKVYGYVEFLGIDVFVCKTSWWFSNRHLFNDYIFGERAWDNIYAAIMAGNSRSYMLFEEGLCFHIKHPETWVDSPYSDYNMSIFNGVDRLYAKKFERFIAHVRNMGKEELTTDNLTRIYNLYFIKSEVEEQIEEKIVQKGLTSIIVIASGNKPITKKCIKTIKKNTPESHEVLIVVNNRNEEYIRWLNKISKENKNKQMIVKVLSDIKSNIGIKFGDETFASKSNKRETSFDTGYINYAKMVNKGISEASGEYIVVMTDDVVVSDGWLSGMLKCLNGLESSGFVGPMSNDAEKGQRIEGFEFKSIEHTNQFAREFMQKNKSRKIITRKVDGFCMLFRRDLIDRIGLFDEQNFSGTYHFVDEDMCLRAVLEGYTNAIAGDVFVYRNQETNAEYIKSLNRIISDNRKMFGIKWSDAEELSPKWRKLLTANALSAAHDFVQKGIPENAVMVLLEAIKHSREDSRLHFSLVDTLIEKKKYIDAITILETMPDIFKEHPKRYEYLSICKEAVGNYEEAEIYADKALKYNDKSAISLNVKGLIAYKKGDVERAEDYFRKAIEIDDSYGEPYANVGAMKWSKGDKEEAFDYFVKACVLSPTVEDIVMNLYNAGVRLTKLNVVEDAFRNAISAYPLNRRLRFLLIDVLMQEGKYVDAMEMLEDFMLDYGMDENTLKIAKSLRDKIGPKEVDKSSEDTISLCMIVKNEEKNIGGCLKKIKPLVDEMIVVDTGSTDMTKDIARAFGAKVYDFKWNNSFSDARNFSIDKASGKWILILDADEAIAPYDFKKLKRLVKETGSKLIAYSFVTRNYVQPMNTVGWVANDGSYIKEEAGTGWYMSEKVRLFPNDDRLRFERPVHELIEYSAIKHGIAIEKCDVPIHHYGKLDRAKVTEKGRDYYELGKIKLAEQGKKNLVAVFELAIQASELELHEEAVEHWKKAIELEPKFPKGYYGLGSSLFTLERYIEAYPALRKAVEMQPDDRDAVLMFSTCELFFGNAKVAIPLLERVLEKDPRFLRALLLIPVCYFCADMSEKGLEILNKLNTMKIDYAKYFIELSKKLYDLNRIPYAISTLNALKMGGYKDEYVDNTIEEYKKRLKEDLFKVRDSRPEISLCMIVKDEEKNIIRCLTAVKPLVDEMIVVDTGSKDNTKKIAQSLGAKVFDFQWNENFSDARNFSIEKASGKWILVIDADEVISPVDFEFIKNLVRHADEHKYAFSLITRNYVNQVNTMGWQPNDGKYIEEAGAGWYYGEKVRLFPNIEGVRFEDPVHERVEPSLEKIGISIIDTYIPVHHYGELDVSKVKAKDELYYELGKQRLAEKGGRDVKALYDLGVQASRLERYEEAIEFFNEVIGLDPDYVKAFESMGNAYYNKGDYEKAKEYYKKVIDKGDPSREVVVMSANCEIFTGNSERAIEVLQRLIEKEPTYPLAMFVYCIAFFTAGLKEKGMGLLSTLKGMNIFALRDFIGYARILISLNRYDYALRILKPLKDMEISSEELDELLGVCKKNMIGG